MEALSDGVDIRFLLGVLNSKYANVLLNTIRGVGNIDVNPEYIRNIPIPPATAAEQKRIIGLVDRILAAKAADTGADVSALESMIDEIVFDLYGLTPSERALVEGGGK